MALLNIDLYVCDDASKLEEKIRPKNCIARKWIAQTLGDQIWVWYEFNTVEEKDEYLEWLKDSNIVCLDPWNSIGKSQKVYKRASHFISNNPSWNQELINQYS